jgi:hypothetical protein
MLIGIEFKRTKVHIIEEGRTVWFWRIAPYVRGVDSTKVGAAVFFVVAMSIIYLIGENVR